MAAYNFFRVHPALTNIVEAIWEADIPDAGTARSIVLPVVSPILCFHYRAPPALCLDFRADAPTTQWIASSSFRITGMQSRAARLRASGPVGGVMVRLKPESASRIGRSLLPDLFDEAAPVGDFFSPTEASLLFEVLAGAKDAAARITAVQDFLLRRLNYDEPDLLVRQAMLLLRTSPALTARQLAVRLDVSERHLSRRFQATTGATPKQFSRIVRIGKVVATARRHRGNWAEIADSCGFNDQAHMINEFHSMVGSSPELFFQTTSLGNQPPPIASAAESDFYNTFVLEVASSGRKAKPAG